MLLRIVSAPVRIDSVPHFLAYCAHPTVLVQRWIGMSARYRVKEHRNWFTPQRRLLGLWVRMSPPQRTMEAANQIIRQALKTKQTPPYQPRA